MNVLFLIAISIASVNVVVLEVSIVLVSNNFSFDSKIWQAFLMQKFKKMIIHFYSANEDDSYFKKSSTVNINTKYILKQDIFEQAADIQQRTSYYEINFTGENALISKNNGYNSTTYIINNDDDTVYVKTGNQYVAIMLKGPYNLIPYTKDNFNASFKSNHISHTIGIVFCCCHLTLNLLFFYLSELDFHGTVYFHGTWLLEKPLI